MSDRAEASQLAASVDRWTRGTALVGFFGLLLMALLIFYDGLARYLAAPRISGFSDYGELVFPVVIASCFPAGLFRRTHITVRLLGHATGPRLSSWLEVFAAALTLVFFVLLAWQFVNMTAVFDAAGRSTPTIELPIAPWWWVATVIMGLCVPVQAYVLGVSALIAWRHDGSESFESAISGRLGEDERSDE